MTPAVIRKVCVVVDCASQRLACPRLVMKLLTFSNIQGILNRSKIAVSVLNCRDLDIFVLDFFAFLSMHLLCGHHSNTFKHVKNTVIIKFLCLLLCVL